MDEEAMDHLKGKVKTYKLTHKFDKKDGDPDDLKAHCPDCFAAKLIEALSQLKTTGKWAPPKENAPQVNGVVSVAAVERRRELATQLEEL